MADELCPSLAELDFMRARLNHHRGAVNSDDNLKKLILITKYWFKTHVKAKFDNIKFKSLVLELICLHTWEKKQLQDTNFDLPKWFNLVLLEILDYQDIQCFWTDKYAESDIPAELRDQKPSIIDPENPWKNVAAQLDWPLVKGEAASISREMESKYSGNPPFQHRL